MSYGIDVPAQAVPVMLPINEEPILSRKRRMNFFDLSNLLDRDGNLQNEMLVFAFAATMLSTIPILLGNEFDVNVGLKRRKRDDSDLEDLGNYYSSYSSYDDGEENFPHVTKNNNYKSVMTEAPKFRDHVEGLNSIPHYGHEDPKADTSLLELLRELLFWANEKVRNKELIPLLIQLGLSRIQGKDNPADRLVMTAYKMWKEWI